MKTALSASLVALGVSAFGITAASAADIVLDVPAPVEVAPEPVLPFFLTLKAGYGPSLIDNEFTTTTPLGTVTDGEFDDDWIAGVGVEAGVFVTDNLRLSAQFNAGRIEHEFEVVSASTNPFVGPGDRFPLEGHTKVYQGFAKAAYEVSFADLGVTAPFFARSGVFATAGVGFTHLRSKADLFANVFNPAVPFDADEEDTVLSGVVGLGSTFAINDRIDLISEVNYTFGGDAELGFTLPATLGGGTAVTEAETNALTAQTGLRFRF